MLKSGRPSCSRSGCGSEIGPSCSTSGSGLPATTRLRRYQKPRREAPARTTSQQPPSAARRRQHHHGHASTPPPSPAPSPGPSRQPDREPGGRNGPADRHSSCLRIAAGVHSSRPTRRSPGLEPRIAIAGEQQRRGHQVVLGRPRLPHDQRVALEQDRGSHDRQLPRARMAARCTKPPGTPPPATRSSGTATACPGPSAGSPPRGAARNSAGRTSS